MNSTGEKKEVNVNWRLIWAKSDTAQFGLNVEADSPRKDNSHEQPKRCIGRETGTQFDRRAMEAALAAVKESHTNTVFLSGT